MKTTYLLFLASWCFCQQSFGQTADSIATVSLLPKIYGTWYKSNSPSSNKNSIIYLRKNRFPFNWGQSIVINKNGDFADAYNSRCGNDPMRHNFIGKWNFDSQTNIFEARFSKNMEGMKFKIEKISKDSLVLAFF